MTINKALFKSDSIEWETPQWLFDELNEEFRFDLDVCASSKNYKCNDFIDKELDALGMADWIGRCWMNPPYGKEIGRWIKKASEESKKGSMVVCLLPARTDTRWFHDYIYKKTEIRFLKGRLKFSNSENSAPFPSMLVIFNNNNKS